MIASFMGGQLAYLRQAMFAQMSGSTGSAGRIDGRQPRSLVLQVLQRQRDLPAVVVDAGMLSRNFDQFDLLI
jgi:hypothetical protein